MGVFTKRHLAPVLFALAFAPFAHGFPCRTEYGAVKVIEPAGFTPGDSAVRKNIQRTRRALGGQNGKVVCVLIPESEAGGDGAYSELITLSQSALTNALDDAGFAEISQNTREQMAVLKKQVVNGLVFDNFREGHRYYFNTLEVGREGSAEATTFTVMGGIHLHGHLFSFVAHTTSANPERRRKWLADAQAWAVKMVAANSTVKPFGDRPPIATVANIDDFKLIAFTLGKTERIRTRDKDRPEAVDVKFEYPRPLEPRPGGGRGYPTLLSGVLDGFVFEVGVGDVPVSAALDAELDAFTVARARDAEAMADGIAGRIAAERGDPPECFDSGYMKIGGRNAAWRDSWAPRDAGGKSPVATKTVWVQLAGGRLFEMKFLLQDTWSEIVPIADLRRFNVGMNKMANSISFQNKRQLKR